MNTNLNGFRIFGIVLLITVIGSCSKTSSTTFYLVRHAEKEESNTMQNQNENPPLAEKGKQRAKNLTKTLPKNRHSPQKKLKLLFIDFPIFIILNQFAYKRTCREI